MTFLNFSFCYQVILHILLYIPYAYSMYVDLRTQPYVRISMYHTQYMSLNMYIIYINVQLKVQIKIKEIFQILLNLISFISYILNDKFSGFPEINIAVSVTFKAKKYFSNRKGYFCCMDLLFRAFSIGLILSVMPGPVFFVLLEIASLRGSEVPQRSTSVS